MSHVILTVGIPASGKSTWAREEAARTGAVIICRDDIRLMQGLKHGQDEDRVTKVAHALLDGAILDGLDVIVADTNLNKTFRNRLVKFCHQRGADVEIKVFPISVDVAILRDAVRVEHVGADVIARFAQQYAQQAPQDELLPVPTYAAYVHATEGRQTIPAIICDIDGTVARHEGHRSPYDYTKVSLDDPIQDVIDVVNLIRQMGVRLLFVSGRDDSCYHATASWIEKHFGLVASDYVLYMRKAKDQRPDYIIKNEIYDADIIPFYKILMVFDDRDQVVTHLRRRGITVAQVAPGRF